MQTDISILNKIIIQINISIHIYCINKLQKVFISIPHRSGTDHMSLQYEEYNFLRPACAQFSNNIQTKFSQDKKTRSKI